MLYVVRHGTRGDWRSVRARAVGQCRAARNLANVREDCDARARDRERAQRAHGRAPRDARAREARLVVSRRQRDLRLQTAIQDVLARANARKWHAPCQCALERAHRRARTRANAHDRSFALVEADVRHAARRVDRLARAVHFAHDEIHLAARINPSHAVWSVCAVVTFVAAIAVVFPARCVHPRRARVRVPVAVREPVAVTVRVLPPCAPEGLHDRDFAVGLRFGIICSSLYRS